MSDLPNEKRSNYREFKKITSPERNLMSEILFRAILDAIGINGYTGKEMSNLDQKDKRSAINFLCVEKEQPVLELYQNGNRTGWTFFEICLHLDLDPIRVHDKIRYLYINKIPILSLR